MIKLMWDLDPRGPTQESDGTDLKRDSRQSVQCRAKWWQAPGRSHPRILSETVID